MPHCPGCGKELKLVQALTLPGDCRSDDIRFQLSRCPGCGQPAAGAYEESRRGALDSECWEHYAWPVTESMWRRCTQLLLLCPEPEREDCGCCAHLQLSRYDANGRWLGCKTLPQGD